MLVGMAARERLSTHPNRTASVFSEADKAELARLMQGKV